jgi:hypothetical protein
MQLTNILLTAALATSAMATYTGHTYGATNTHVAPSSDKDSHKAGSHHYVRDAAPEHSEHYDPKHEHSENKDPEHLHHARDARDHKEAAKHHDAPKHEKSLDRRTLGVYWCTKHNWKGTCHKVAADNKCHPWTPGAGGSIGPDPGVTCRWHEDADCGGPVSNYFYYPGNSNVQWFAVGSGNTQVEYYAGGYKCWKT